MKGFRKAVVMQQETWTPQLTCVHFSDVCPEQESNQRASRPRTPWPAAQPCGPDNACMIDIEHLEHHEHLQCQLVFDVDELQEFLAADNSHILWKDYHQFELPDFIREALDRCQSVDRIDRYVIFTDGSSQTCHKHKPPLWIAENDISDSWAFAVFAEQYGTHPDEPSTLEFLGWSCQTVLYDQDAAHSIGTSRIGSDASETEAMAPQPQRCGANCFRERLTSSWRPGSRPMWIYHQGHALLQLESSLPSTSRWTPRTRPPSRACSQSHR